MNNKLREIKEIFDIPIFPFIGRRVKISSSDKEIFFYGFLEKITMFKTNICNLIIRNPMVNFSEKVRYPEKTIFSEYMVSKTYEADIYNKNNNNEFYTLQDVKIVGKSGGLSASGKSFNAMECIGHFKQ